MSGHQTGRDLENPCGLDVIRISDFRGGGLDEKHVTAANEYIRGGRRCREQLCMLLIGVVGGSALLIDRRGRNMNNKRVNKL